MEDLQQAIESDDPEQVLAECNTLLGEAEQRLKGTNDEKYSTLTPT